MDLARKRGIKVVEREIWPDELAKATEVFLTGTAVEVQPVGAIDGREYPVGPVTQQLQADYAALVRVDWRAWREPTAAWSRPGRSRPRSPERTMKSAVTISLVPEARGGPFVFWDDLAAACRKAGALGFDAVEVFPPGPDAVDPDELRALLDDNGLSLAAVGTGAGWVKHKLTLTSPDEADPREGDRVRRSDHRLRRGVRAPRRSSARCRAEWRRARSRSRSRCATSATRSSSSTSTPRDLGTTLLYEPLNRYETNLVNTLADAVQLLDAARRRAT